MNSNGFNWSISQDQIQLSCSDALLPGSTLTTHELNSDRTGVTERHVYRRTYDDRIDLSFYVTVDPKNPYVAIRFFELWMKYVTNESIAGQNSVKNSNFFYQVKYPEEYYGNLKITKFERTAKNGVYTGSQLIYNFVNAYPINITSMPISYESSQLLKITVAFSYIRYYIQDLLGEQDSGKLQTQSSTTTPLSQGFSNSRVLSSKSFLENPIFNDFLNADIQKDGRIIGNPNLDQFGVRDQLGRGAPETIGPNILA